MNIPNNPAILLSFINTKLRDNYKDLDELCDDMELDETEITAKLAMLGYTYKKERNQFV